MHPHRVLITNGWLQGFALLAEARAAGAVAVVEFPGYDRALRLLLAQGATLLYADWHDDGIALDMLAEQMRMSQIPPTFSLWSPTFHNPTGLTLTLRAALGHRPADAPVGDHDGRGRHLRPAPLRG